MTITFSDELKTEKSGEAEASDSPQAYLKNNRRRRSSQMLVTHRRVFEGVVALVVIVIIIGLAFLALSYVASHRESNSNAAASKKKDDERTFFYVDFHRETLTEQRLYELLCKAVASNNRQLVVELFTSKQRSQIDINRNDTGVDGCEPTPFLAAVRGSASEDLVDYLIDEGNADFAGINSTWPIKPAIFYSARAGNYNATVALLRRNVEINVPLAETGLLPIFEAIVAGHQSVFELLLDHNSSLISNNFTVWHHAAVHCSLPGLRMLVNDSRTAVLINQGDTSGWSPLFFIVKATGCQGKQNAMVEALNVLIDAGADVDAVDYWGRSFRQLVETDLPALRLNLTLTTKQ